MLLSEVNRAFLHAGIVLFVDVDGILTGHPHGPRNAKKWQELEKLLAGRYGEMRRFLIHAAFPRKGETK
jgi:hypothetical protein